MKRRNFIRVAGGGVVFAAVAGAGVTACAPTSAYPAAAVEAWQGPGSTETEPRRRALAYAITAPNPHNLQPWLVDLREADVITVRTDPTRVLPETDPFGRQILVGHGAFIELLVIALAEQGFASRVQLWPGGELPATLDGWDRRPIARIEIEPAAATAPREPLFARILERHTPKVDFDIARVIAPETLRSLLAAHASAGVEANGTLDTGRVSALRRLCWDSARVELLDPRTVMESVRLTRVGPAEILRHRDGISINSLFPRAAMMLGQFDRTQPPAEGSAAYGQMMKRFKGHSETSMGFVWLTTPGNRRSQQINAGRAYVRLQLQATTLGLGVHPMSQALQEFGAMRTHYEAAHRLLLNRPAPKAIDDPVVQMLCRIGYTAAPVAGTPRRPLEASILT